MTCQSLYGKKNRLPSLYVTTGVTPRLSHLFVPHLCPALNRYCAGMRQVAQYAHSYRNASIGSSLAAFCAGQIPNTTPTTREKTVESTTE